MAESPIAGEGVGCDANPKHWFTASLAMLGVVGVMVHREEWCPFCQAACCVQKTSISSAQTDQFVSQAGTGAGNCKGGLSEQRLQHLIFQISGFGRRRFQESKTF